MPDVAVGDSEMIGEFMCTPMYVSTVNYCVIVE